eukprot:CAMPEP_0119324272 /NCGR_PEP_ID=MMETSP1333-20130426/62740_1 /TAXON_ID=418940 /ORGANISM="Scyphosphaera apsteinii, Strain RCC1455" /LENGTH=246 /DNA_ID=CAMNT_0007331941 /DNA_START=74 /DNA_END=812 /DNA_ORIENTATION=-
MADDADILSKDVPQFHILTDSPFEQILHNSGLWLCSKNQACLVEKLMQIPVSDIESAGWRAVCNDVTTYDEACGEALKLIESGGHTVLFPMAVNREMAQANYKLLYKELRAVRREPWREESNKGSQTRQGGTQVINLTNEQTQLGLSGLDRRNVHGIPATVAHKVACDYDDLPKDVTRWASETLSMGEGSDQEAAMPQVIAIIISAASADFADLLNGWKGHHLCAQLIEALQIARANKIKKAVDWG